MAKQAIDSATGAILQADGPRARQLLADISTAALSAKDLQFRECTLSRLDGKVPDTIIISPVTHAPDAFAMRALGFYRAYWHDSVAKPADRADTEKRLLSNIATLLGRPSLANMDDAEPLVAARLQQDGFRSLEGKTGLLHELMIWTKGRPYRDGAAAGRRERDPRNLSRRLHQPGVEQLSDV